MPAPEELERRLDRLEREARRWRLGSLLLLGGLAGVLAVSFACPAAPAPPASVLEAERFVLRGAAGEELAVLGTDTKGNPNLLLRRGQSHAIVTLSGPAVQVRGEDGKTGAFLGVDTRGDSRLELTSARMHDGVRAAVHPDGSSGVYVLDAEGRERAALEYLATGAAQLTARDGRGGIRSYLGLDEKGVASSLVLDPIGRRRLGLLVAPDGTPTLAAEDGEGRLRAQLTMDQDGLPLLQLLRADGEPMFQEPR
ncbi:MAG: hypothetical protein AB1726_02330 [Planctomycetota bacterium]